MKKDKSEKKEEKVVYIMCPRCELNYIPKKEKFCKVCKAEMGLIDPAILIPDEEEIGVEKLCPFCKENYIGEDETICFLCQKEREKKSQNDEHEWGEEFDVEPAEEDLESDDDLDLVITPDEEGFEGEENEEEEEFAEQYKEPDDFDFNVDESDFEDYEEEDEEEDEDEELSV